MTLLSIDEIQYRLDKEFLPLEPMLIGLRLVNAELSEDSILDCERELSINLPTSFRKLVSSFNFGNLTIGPVVFCVTGDYLKELVELNIQVCWWGNGQRPSNLLMVGNSDPFAILLDLDTGATFAMDSEIGWQKSVKIARNFNDFVRGVGTVMLSRNETEDRKQLAEIILDDVGGESLEFWYGLAK